MKFSHIGLDRYGRFTDRQIELDPAAPVVIIEGANEAGKTTALNATSDLLFGIDERSRFNFLHDYKSMRLSATITDADGRTLSFARLKRRNAPLVNPADDTPLADDALAPFLGLHDRKAFLDIYGLDQHRLRAGGKAMVAGGGALAETLLSIAPGLAHVASLRDSLQRSAAEMFNPARRSSNQQFYRAIKQREEALSQLKAQELRLSDVRKTRKEAELAQTGRRHAEEAETEAGRAVNNALLLRRAAGELRTIARLEQSLAALGPLPQIAPAVLARARALLAAHENAQEQVARTTHEEEAALAACAAIMVDSAILENADGIEQCADAYVAMRDKRSALPNRMRERDDARLILTRIATDLGLCGLEELRSRLPARPLMARAAQLADKLRSHEAHIQTVEQERASLDRRRREAQAALENGTPVEDPADLARRLGDLDGAEVRETSLREFISRLAAARKALETRIARLPFGPHELEPLMLCPLPDMASTQARLDAVSATEEAIARAHVLLAEVTSEHARKLARLRVLDAGGTAPTPAAIEAARANRDKLWAGLRPLATGARSLNPDDAVQAEALDAAIMTADRLADDRQTETERLAELARTTLDLADLDTRITLAQAGLESAETTHARAGTDWATLWNSSGFTPDATPQALAFLREVETIRQEREAIRRDEAQARSLAETRRWDREETDRLRAALSLSPLGDAPLRMAELRSAVRQREEAFQTLRDSQRDLKRLDEAAQDLATRTDELTHQSERLREEAEAVFPALALRTAATADEARSALELWQEALGQSGNLETAERRITQIEQNEATFIAQVETLLAHIGSAPAGDAYAAAAQLRERLKDARDARTRAREAETTQAARTHARVAAQARQVEARGKLDEILVLGGLCEPEELPAWLDLMDQALSARTEKAEALGRLDEMRGARSLEEIRSSIGEADDDALTQRAEVCANAQEEARAARDRAVEHATQARLALEALEKRDGAATAAQQAQDALAEIAEASERFTRDHVTSRLLARAIERYREAHQHPILNRASAAFRTLTNGRWEGIAVDYDADTPRLAATREAQLLNFDALSEGTADQLFLALRVAAIEEHASRAAPLPFLADDLFVSFDETRTEAGLRLMKELGAHTQVIIFTHHRHVTACAERTLGDAACIIHL